MPSHRPHHVSGLPTASARRSAHQVSDADPFEQDAHNTHHGADHLGRDPEIAARIARHDQLLRQGAQTTQRVSSALSATAQPLGEQGASRDAVADLQSTIRQLTVDNNELKGQKQSLNERITTLQTLLQVARESRRSHSKSALERYNASLDALRNRNMRLEEIKNRQQEAISTLRERNELLRSRIERLTEQLRVQKDSRIRLLEGERERAMAVKEKSDTAVKRLREANDQHVQRLNRLRLALEKQRSTNAALRSKDESLRLQLADANSRSAAEVSARKEAQSEHNSQIIELRSKHNDSAKALRESLTAITERNSRLKETVQKLGDKNKDLRSTILRQNERIDRLKTLLKDSKELREKERRHNADLSERTRDLKRVLAETREKNATSRAALVESLRTSRERLQTTSSLWNSARTYYTVFQQGILYDQIEKSGIDLSADTYLCLLPSTVPAALSLKNVYGGRVICDCVENVDVERHSLAPKLPYTTLTMVNLMAYGALSRSDGLMTVSNAVARTLTDYGLPVRVQPNFRRYEVPCSRGTLRDWAGLPSSAKVLVTSGNVVNGFENILDAMTLLPADVHLVALIKISPPAYAQEIESLITKLGLSDRVHLKGFVPYDQLAGLLADADLGLIPLDPDNPNHSVSLPNRVFDFVTAGLPFVVPPIPEIADFAQEHKCGTALSEVSGEAWSVAIRSMLSELPRYRDAVLKAREMTTWESLDEGLIDFLGNPSSVTLLGFRDLSRYQRFLRVADSLTQRGIRVKAVFMSSDPLPLANPDVEFYHFRDRYGRGPGLERVPHVGQ